MASTPNRPSSGPRDCCIFCGNERLSKEHIFPSWLGRMVPRTATEQHKRAKSVGEGPPVYIERNGKALTTKYRIVCEACNGTWMSGIETATKPILLRLMQGKATTLTFADQLQIVTWLTLKTMLIDRALQDFSVIPQEQRTAMLGAPGPMGDTWRIWIGRSEMAFGQCGFFSTSAPTWLYRKSTLEKVVPDNPGEPNAVAIALFSGHFLGVAASWPFIPVADTFRYWASGQILQLLWPYNALAFRELDWPPDDFIVTLGGMSHVPECILTGAPLPLRSNLKF